MWWCCWLRKTGTTGLVWLMLDRLLEPKDVKYRQEYCQICAVINLAVYTYNTLMTE